MRYYLVCVGGMQKGRLWPIDSTGLLLGRDPACEIRLAEPVVSRYQCRILMRGDQACVEDMGARNPMLLNGTPVTTAPLKPGDTLGLGRSLFLIVDTAPDMAPQPDLPAPEPTAAWDTDSPIALSIQDAWQQVDPRPKSLADLVYLYDLSRELNRQSTRDTFLHTLEQQVRERFKPRGYHVVFSFGQEETAFYESHTATAGDERKAIKTIARECLKQRQGLLRLGLAGDGGKRRLFTMAAPLITGDIQMGALVLHTETPEGAFDEDDLKLLVLLAGSAAPILYTIEHVELLAQDNARLRALSGESNTLVGPGRRMGQVRKDLRNAAKTNLNVLITGETGTGKELAARMLHAQSAQHSKPFVVVNCAAIPRDLFESELFGYKKGAFTGANADMPGLLPLAQGGILFLDEIGDLSLDNQARILRVVEQGTFRPVGGKEELRLCIRIAAATNHDLEKDIGEGRFRADLYHRLNAYRVELPPLREHAEDISALVLHFIELARSFGKHPITGIAPEALEMLQKRSWPGNVRELRNCVMRAVALAKSDVLGVKDFPNLPPIAGSPTQEGDVLLSLSEVEKHHIKAVIDRCQGNLKTTAETLQIARSTLYKKISEYNIE